MDSEGNKIGQSYEKKQASINILNQKCLISLEYRLSQTDYTGIGGKEGFKAEYAKSTVYFDADGKTGRKEF